MDKRKQLKYKVIVWVICLLIMLIGESFFKSAPWVYDAFDYWNRGDSLKNSGFNLSAAMDGFRGYIFPLYLGLINLIGGRSAWFIISAIVYSVFCALIYPTIGQNMEFLKNNIIKIIIANALIVILFVGAFAYPLSDFFALMCCCYATYFCKKVYDMQNNYCYLFAFLMGVFTYWAYNVRTIYLFAGIVLFLVFIIVMIKSRGIIESILKTVTGFLGIICAAIPQIILNYDHLKKFSISVPTNGLFLQQVFWGIETQRYDTYVPPFLDEIHSRPQVYFSDPSGMAILRELNISQFDNWKTFIRVFISHPLDIILLYVRHFINFIFPRWPQMYVENLHSSKWFFAILSISIWFLFLIAYEKRCVKDNKSILYYLPLLAVGFFIIPGAVEYRFSLPFYVFVISQICFNVDYSKLKKEIQNCKINTIMMYLIFAILCLVIWSNMLANESVTPLLF